MSETKRWENPVVLKKLKEYLQEGFLENKEWGYSFAELADYLNSDTDVIFKDFSGGMVRSFCRRNPEFMGLKRGEENTKIEEEITVKSEFEIEFVDKKKGEVDWREWGQHLKDSQKLYEKASFSQDVAKVKIKTDKPIGVVYSADWHLGSRGTNYAKFFEDIEFILSQDNLKLALVGDLIDNFNSFKNVLAVHQQLISPKAQKKVLESLLTELFEKDKIICSGYGNHDVEWDEKVIGQSIIQDMLSKNVPYFNGKGILMLEVGDQKYSNLLMHKTRYSSFLNALHGSKREFQLHFPADVVVSAHTHRGGFEEYIHYEDARAVGLNIGGEIFLIQLGTYKIDCGYSKRYWKSGVLQADTVVYFPDVNLKKRFRTANDAVTFMAGLECKCK